MTHVILDINVKAREKPPEVKKTTPLDSVSVSPIERIVEQIFDVEKNIAEGREEFKAISVQHGKCLQLQTELVTEFKDLANFVGEDLPDGIKTLFRKIENYNKGLKSYSREFKKTEAELAHWGGHGEKLDVLFQKYQESPEKPC